MRAIARTVLVALAASLPFAGSTPLRAQEAPAPQPAPAPPRPADTQRTEVVIDFDTAPAADWLREQYYGVFRGDARVGWLRRTLELVEWGEGEPAVKRSVESFVNVAGDGNTQRTAEHAIYRLAEPQVLLEIQRRVVSQGRVGSRRAVLREGRFEVETERDGERTEGAVAAVDVRLCDELVTERAVAAARARDDGAAVAEAAAALDLARMRLIRRAVAVVGTETDEEGAPVYLVAVASGPDSWSDPVHVDAHGGLVRGSLGGDLEMRRMAKDDALAKLGSTSMEVADRVRMDARLGDVLTIREMEISMPVPPEGAPAPFPSTGRQICDTFEGRVHLRIHVARDAGDPTDEEREAALQADERIDCENPAIVAAVNRVLAGTSRPAVRVTRLLEFVASHVRDSVVVEEPAASEILRSRIGDCTEHTRLFVALARAAGIPAREVTGLIWLDDEQQAFGWHAWAEVELGGRWRPVDPTGGRSPAHAAHIRIDPAARAAGEFRDLRFQLHDIVR